MNKQTIRAFSSGILFSVIVTLVFINFFPESTEQTEKTIKEGYITIQKDELKQKEEKIKSLEKELSRQNDSNNNAKKDNASKETKQLTLNVESGMKSQDISENLANANIIKNKTDFENFLIKEGYADKIQVGQHVIDSTMSFQEIADIITEK